LGGVKGLDAEASMVILNKEAEIGHQAGPERGLFPPTGHFLQDFPRFANNEISR